MRRRPTDPGQDPAARHFRVPSDREYPFRTERQERRLARRRPPNVPLSDALTGASAEVAGYLANTAVREILDAMRLSPLERAVVEERLAGASVRDVAAATGLKKWRVEKALVTLRRRWAALESGEPPARVRREAGWQDVYQAETRRRGRRTIDDGE